MSNPDWARVMARPPDQFQKVGDPTRWGASDVVNIVNNSIQQSSRQVLQLTTRDPYARSWAILGTLTMPVSVWDTPQMIASLVLTMGVGQAAVRQEIALWIGTGSAGGPGGLIYQQDSVNGGVYIRSDNFLVPNPLGTPPGIVVAYNTRAFAIIGGLIGQSVQVIGRYGILAAILPDELPAPATLNLAATPFAAGEGL